MDTRFQRLYMFARCAIPTVLTSTITDFDRREMAAAKPEVVDLTLDKRYKSDSPYYL